jgi:hypothetical protein
METKITRTKGTKDFELGVVRQTYIGNGIIAREVLGAGGRVRTQKSGRTYRGSKSVTK